MNIGDFARLGPVSPRMLRHYDQHGILQPLGTDPATGYRNYSVTQLPQLHRILALRDLGFGTEEIRTLLGNDPTVEELRNMLQKRRNELESTIEAERNRLHQVEAHLRAIERNPEMSNANVVIKHSQPMRIAEMHGEASGGGPSNVGPIFGALIPELLNVLTPHGVTPGICVGRYDGPDEDGTLGVRVGFVIGDHQLDAPNVHIVDVPAREVASLVHEGPIDAITSHYEDLYRWVEDSGRQPAANAIELYLNWDEENPQNNIIELQLPLA